MKLRNFYLPLFTLTVMILISCDNQGFVETTRDDKNQKKLHSLNISNSVKIKSFYLTYNPKDRGYIKLELQNGKTYEAKSVDGGSFSSVNSLLKEPDVLFDTIRKEVVLKKDFQN